MLTHTTESQHTDAFYSKQIEEARMAQEEKHSPPPSYKSAPSSIDQPTHTIPSTNTTTLQVKYADALTRHGQILDAATGEALYTSEHRYRSPQFTLANASSTLLTADSSKWSMKMAFTTTSTGQEFPLQTRGKLSKDMSYASPAFGGQTLTWEHQRHWGKIEYVCLDDQGQAIARVKGGSSWKCMPWGNFATMELVDERVETQAQRDEVVAVGLGLSYKAVQHRQAATTAVVVT